MAKLKCSVCGSTKHVRLQCENCGAMLCTKCAKKYDKTILGHKAKNVVCPKCGHKGFRYISKFLIF